MPPCPTDHLGARLRAALAGALAAAAAPGTALACATDAMIVFDGSNSMAEIGPALGPVPRIDEARAAMARILPEVEGARRFGLVTYGPGGADACSGLRRHFGPRAEAAAPALAALERLEPQGLTPLTAAVALAAEALDHRARPAIVVLVTDGNETCGGRPCALAERLAAESVDLTVHVLGYKVVWDFFAWNNPEQSAYFGGEVTAKCLADRTGGLYASTETEAELVDALRATLGCTLVGRLDPA